MYCIAMDRKSLTIFVFIPCVFPNASENVSAIGCPALSQYRHRQYRPKPISVGPYWQTDLSRLLVIGTAEEEEQKNRDYRGGQDAKGRFP